MAFKKGQSGNPKGRPPGTKNKKTAFLDELTALGLTPAQMLANSYAVALKNGDYATAQKAADTAVKYCYSVPVDLPEAGEGAGASEIKVVFVGSDKANSETNPETE